jgi:excisionase family DNA binding protein
MARTRKKNVNRQRKAEAVAKSEPKRVLTPNEVAAYCGFGRDYAYRLLRTGTIPSLPREPNGRFRVPIDWLDEFLKSADRRKVA